MREGMEKWVSQSTRMSVCLSACIPLFRVVAVLGVGVGGAGGGGGW